MPVQSQPSTLAQRFGSRIAQANAEHKDKPLDLGGFKRLPPGIKNGVGKLSSVVMKVYSQTEKIQALRGNEYLHVAGVVMSPEYAPNGEKVVNEQMYLRFPLCDIPANPQNKFSKAKSFNDNWYEFQQFFKRFGIDPPNENPQTDPTGVRTLAYYNAAIQSLNNGRPRYYHFETRAWRPQGATEDRIEEEWGKEIEWNGQVDPGAGVTVNTQPEPMTQAPSVLNPNPTQQSESFNELASGEVDAADVITSLVEVAMADPQGTTPDGVSAGQQLEDAAWKNGWTKEQTAGAADWAAVGDMALNPPTPEQKFPNSPTITAAAGTGNTAAHQGPTIGSKHRFAKRTKDGARLKDNKGQEFPAQEVEVLTVDPATKTCTVKGTKDGKPIVDIRSKQPVAVKFEWLE